MRVQVDAQQAFGAPGSFFGAEDAITVDSTTEVDVISQGCWMIKTGSTGLINYTPDSGSTTRTAIAASSFGIIFSDGFNVVLDTNAGTSTDTDVTYITQIKAVF